MGAAITELLTSTSVEWPHHRLVERVTAPTVALSLCRQLIGVVERESTTEKPSSTTYAACQSERRRSRKKRRKLIRSKRVPWSPEVASWRGSFRISTLRVGLAVERGWFVLRGREDVRLCTAPPCLIRTSPPPQQWRRSDRDTTGRNTPRPHGSPLSNGTQIL